MARDPKADPYYNPEFSPEVNEVTNDFVYKKTGKQTTGDAIIVRPRGGSFDVLLIERKRGPHQGGLALPGGFKEGADSVEDFVAREALEETGLTNKDIKETIDLPTKTDRFDWDVRFADGVDVSGKIFMVDDSFIPKAGDDAVSAKFVPVEDIASGKVDIAFLHSEWIYDTSQILDSNYSGTSELQEIVAKDRKRNIDFMEEINTKRTIDNQPLMTIDQSTPIKNAAKEKFVNNYIANNPNLDPKVANERALIEFEERYSFEIDQAQGTFEPGKIEAGTSNKVQNYSMKGLDFLGKAVAPIDEALEIGIPKLFANTALAPFAQGLIKTYRQLALANLGIAVTRGLYESKVMGENYQNLLQDPDNPEYIAERERLNQAGIQAFSDHMSTYDPSIRFIDKATEENFGFNQTDAATKVFGGIRNLFGGKK